ncbi:MULTISPECIES: hypothetical protein [Brevibacillus]|uniref:hypothetical protein n=1 Tax=Brevibacillus TaxID=55080 RepID=UPI00039D082D|nr:hypothetical protein [Brevibacillus borstelensis]MCM3558856.1 hypothetical protein [Brevibacillus borstelensis]MED1850917.1 hypothetical protein [Brevibacillus borstelensis]GED54422.1 hypothetical protein BBO01nite_36630 [Brevibacillus borstelensis]
MIGKLFLGALLLVWTFAEFFFTPCASKKRERLLFFLVLLAISGGIYFLFL